MQSKLILIVQPLMCLANNCLYLVYGKFQGHSSLMPENHRLKLTAESGDGKLRSRGAKAQYIWRLYWVVKLNGQ